MILWFAAGNGKEGIGRWKVEGGRWKVEGGRWKVEIGKLKVESGRWKLEIGCFCRDEECLVPTPRFYGFITACFNLSLSLFSA